MLVGELAFYAGTFFCVRIREGEGVFRNSPEESSEDDGG